jgi:hypothetical protein
MLFGPLHQSEKQRRQCAYNVKVARVSATIVLLEKQYALHILSVSVALRIKHKIHTLHLCPTRLYSIIPHYLKNLAIFLKIKLLYIKLCFHVSKTFV